MRDAVGRSVMALLALSALAAAGMSASGLDSFGADRIWVEAWRMFGLIAFAALFALLARFPRRLPGIWEVAFLHKAALFVFGGFATGAAERESMWVDLILALCIALAWWLCRGWQSWKGPA